MYAKLFSREVLMSSLTQYQPVENRGVFFMLIAAADKNGYVLGDDESIARVINVPMPTFSKALEAMMAPDAKSKSKEYDGRRIIRLEDSPGLFIVNYEKYSGIGSDEQRREYFRVKKAESRAKAKAATANVPKPPVPPPVDDGDDEEMNIDTLYEIYPKKVGKPDAIKAIRKALREFDFAMLLEKTKAYAAARVGQDAQYTPYPSTWFNRHRFNDEPSTWKDGKPSKPLVEQNQIHEVINVPSL